MVEKFLIVFLKNNNSNMKKRLNKEQILGIVRHSLTFAGGMLVVFGIVEEGIISEITGSLITLVGLIWSVIDKK